MGYFEKLNQQWIENPGICVFCGQSTLSPSQVIGVGGIRVEAEVYCHNCDVWIRDILELDSIIGIGELKQADYKNSFLETCPSCHQHTLDYKIPIDLKTLKGVVQCDECFLEWEESYTRIGANTFSERAIKRWIQRNKERVLDCIKVQLDPGDLLRVFEEVFNLETELVIDHINGYDT